MHNQLYYGDNLDVLRRHVKDESVDLVYLDPPFNSNANYNVLFAAKDGHQSTAQIEAFEDTWHWDQAAARQFAETVEAGGKVADVLLAFERFLGTNDMLAYLTMMAPRLIELRRVMKRTASLYLHCDPTASHYLKLLLDAVFGPTNFKNEVIWRRTSAHGDARRKLGAIHDVILYYTRNAGEAVFNPVFIEMDDAYLARFRLDDEDGRGRYRLAPLDSPNRRPNLTYAYKGFEPPAKGWRVNVELMQQLDREGRLAFPKSPGGRIARKHYLSDQEGAKAGDVWTDIPPLQASSAERLGYPTQKPVALLERILSASSNPGDVVLDPFCGCGTAIDAAQKLGRQWIGIDITSLATTLIKVRLRDTFGDAAMYQVIGEPTTEDDAAELAATDKYQFQWWALGLVGARPVDQKKGADKGIDGRLYFHDGGPATRQIIFSVKGGHLKATDLRDLRGVIDREKADSGVLVSFEPPTKLMRTEAASAGYYTSPWGKHARLQLLTVAELLDGAAVDYPKTAGVNQTFKRAPKAALKVAEPLGLFEGGLLAKPPRKK